MVTVSPLVVTVHVDVVWCGDAPLLCLPDTTPDLCVPKLVSVACVKVGLVGGRALILVDLLVPLLTLETASCLSPDPEAAP